MVSCSSWLIIDNTIDRDFAPSFRNALVPWFFLKQVEKAMRQYHFNQSMLIALCVVTILMHFGLGGSKIVIYKLKS